MSPFFKKSVRNIDFFQELDIFIEKITTSLESGTNKDKPFWDLTHEIADSTSAPATK